MTSKLREWKHITGDKTGTGDASDAAQIEVLLRVDG
jgi:hypothetical protein